MKITINEALEKAIKAHKAGKIQEADKFYTSILKVHPKHPDANHNIGILAAGIGKTNEALTFFKIALESNSKVPQYWLSYIKILIKLQKLDQALQALHTCLRAGIVEEKPVEKTKENDKKSLRIKHGFAKAHLDIGDLLQNKNKLEAAISSYKEAISIKPNYAEAYVNMANALHSKGNFQSAIDKYLKSLEFQPDRAETHYNIGVAYKSKGDLIAAIDSCKRAIILKPNYSEAYCNMGVALQENGNTAAAIDSFKRAIEINPDFTEAYSNMGFSLKGITFSKPRPGLSEIIVKLLEKKNLVRPKDIILAIISLLKFNPLINESLNKHKTDNLDKNLLKTCSELAKIPLLLKAMRTCPIPDMEIEGLLAGIRSSTLLNFSEIEYTVEGQEFISALASQCFINEYLYNQTNEETQILLDLEKSIEKKLLSGSQPTIIEIAILASYKALHQYTWCDLLSIPEELAELEKRQIQEIQEENNLRASITNLQSIKDEISLKVRNQYEVNPYPRWIDLGMNLTPKSISEVVKETKLKICNNQIYKRKKLDILIAGCGTGQHSIGSASRYKNCNITAIDLSLKSLAYAKRKTNEAGLTNIEYIQADILDLGNLNKKFDIIESAGVLHHMSDPLEGWKVLTQSLKENGLMRIGLYSNLARQHIAKTQKEITQTKIGSDDLSMKIFRNKIIRSQENHHKKVILTGDFYSVSSLRDLLFHVQEHRFTIPQIENCLSILDMEFCGFESERIIQNFLAQNTNFNDLYDLRKWHKFEKNHPHTFGSMYVFWCQKL